MANPAPTLNQINAFNATQGTTIDFNIIGGTELVRSNKIYIYDLSDNSLICTHLYVSTESIHELPANTDSSMVYESGKSSANFVNGAQYYAQIQTYTDTAGTQGGSGLSVAKMFWCLVDPTLTITTIPSTISTTSYNVSATYTDTSASIVSNIIQQYQFNLYSAVGSLLQSSGVVVGSGTQQGTSDVYDISYNFTGLNVGSSYYVVVDVTTTQGMNVSTQSNTFTVSIDTPTLGEATVVNNACDGYISVTSNLSSEYGGSASGEIASFVTDSVNNVSSLKVALDPIQDLYGYDAPWVGGAGKNKSSVNELTNIGWASSNADILASMNTLSEGTYTLSFDVKLTSVSKTGAWQDGVFFANPNGNFPKYNNFSADPTVGFTDTVEYTFTISASQVGAFTACYLYGCGSNGQGEMGKATLSNIQIESGNQKTSFAPYSNICPISGHDEVEVSVVGKNLLNIDDAEIGTAWNGATNSTRARLIIPCKPNTQYVLSMNGTNNLDGVYITKSSTIPPTTAPGLVTFPKQVTTQATSNYIVLGFNKTAIAKADIEALKLQLELGSTATEYEPYNGNTYTTALGRTVYGGTLDVVSGVLTVTHKLLKVSDVSWSYNSANIRFLSSLQSDLKTPASNAEVVNAISSAYNAVKIDDIRNAPSGSFGLSSGGYISVRDDNFTVLNDFISARGNETFVFELATPQTYQLTPRQIQTLVGQNNVWSDVGDVTVTYNIPITNLLVKRQDVADVSGTWLTLYSQPITQASDMDFTFIDFLNQYGKTYKYALVPLLTQTQSGVEVEVEGGYTVSDEVQSIFDGVFIADSTGSQKCKANVGYGNVDMNQVVGSITPIGAKYPIVITNSQNQYHNGSISGTIVPDDYYFNGNLSRIDMVNKRSELEQFLTNKRAKIIKDWNGNIWLVMIMDNVSCTFNNNYGMGIVNFSTSWVEIGDPTNQQDLQATGLINIGGV